MIKLGVNTVLFRDHDFKTAVSQIAECGYDGIEISAIAGMCEHLELDRWKEQASELTSIVNDAGIEFLAMEEARLEEDRLELAFEAAAALGIPVVNVGPGGKSDVEEDIAHTIDMLGRAAERAQEYGVSICVKAHVNAAIYDTETTLRAMSEIDSPAFGIDMDPSHIYRGGENPAEALGKLLPRVKHIHIRDCKGRQDGPGVPRDQACGRGDIDLAAYCRAMVEGRYDGPVCLEVIGAKDHPVELCSIIAAETYGYLNATLRAAGGR